MMLAESTNSGTRRAADSALGLLQLEAYVGPPQGFWRAYLEAVCELIGAERAWLMTQQERRPWQVALSAGHADGNLVGLPDRMLKLAHQVAQDGFAIHPQTPAGAMLGYRLGYGPDARANDSVIVVWLAEHQPAQDSLLKHLVTLAESIPARYLEARQRLQGGSAEDGAQRLYDIISLTQRLAEETRFQRLSMALCNTLAERFQADRVSLGWAHGEHIKLRAVSHIEKFDKKSNATRDLVAAMEECLDQQLVVTFPLDEQAAQTVYRAHESMVRLHGIGAVTSIPIWLGEQGLGVLTFERTSGCLNSTECWEADLICRSAAKILRDVQYHDRWFGARWWDRLLAAAAWVVGPRQVAIKLAGLLGVALLLCVILLPWTYKVEATATLKSDALMFVPAPFDGYLAEVHVAIGDQVSQGTPMVDLETDELRLEAQIARAEITRFDREAEKAQAARDLSAMQIASAKRDQAEARLAMAEHKLARASVRAPFAGVVVEGELKRNLGAPLRQGDLLLKLARLDEVILDLDVPEEQVHEVQAGLSGEVAFVGRPDERFPLTIEYVEPIAFADGQSSVVRARARVDAPRQPWWRPGVGGTAKIEIGERPLWWVLSHRTINALREFFWL